MFVYTISYVKNVHVQKFLLRPGQYVGTVYLWFLRQEFNVYSKQGREGSGKQEADEPQYKMLVLFLHCLFWVLETREFLGFSYNNVSLYKLFFIYVSLLLDFTMVLYWVERVCISIHRNWQTFFKSTTKNVKHVPCLEGQFL